MVSFCLPLLLVSSRACVIWLMKTRLFHENPTLLEKAIILSSVIFFSGFSDFRFPIFSGGVRVSSRTENKERGETNKNERADSSNECLTQREVSKLFNQV
jgi:hypothetical protein